MKLKRKTGAENQTGQIQSRRTERVVIKGAPAFKESSKDGKFECCVGGQTKRKSL